MFIPFDKLIVISGVKFLAIVSDVALIIMGLVNIYLVIYHKFLERRQQDQYKQDNLFSNLVLLPNINSFYRSFNELEQLVSEIKNGSIDPATNLFIGDYNATMDRIMIICQNIRREFLLLMQIRSNDLYKKLVNEIDILLEKIALSFFNTPSQKHTIDKLDRYLEQYKIQTLKLIMTELGNN